jgi:hypothetical protein
METIKEILQTKEVITEIKYQKFSLTKLVSLSFVAECYGGCWKLDNMSLFLKSPPF